MANEKNIETVKGMYAAFGKGDVAAILSGLAENVDWGVETEARDVPWWQRYRGRADVARFFVALDAETVFTKFEPQSFVAQSDEVITQVDWSARSKRTGKTIDQTTTHRFHFNAQGQVTRWRATEDTGRTRSFLTPNITAQELSLFGGRWMDALDRRDLAALGKMCGDGFQMYGLAPAALDTAGTQGAMSGLFEAFPDSRMPIEALLVNTDSVAIVHRFEGTHRAPFQGFPPTGKRVNVTATVTVRLRDGLAVEGKLNADFLGMMQQLGAIPTTLVSSGPSRGQ